MPSQKAVKRLQKDPVLARIIAAVGPLDITVTDNHFYTLVDCVASQQLSGKASETILGRLKALYTTHNYPTPEDILATPEDVLRSVGFSWSKIRYLKDLARNFREGIVNPAEFDDLSDQEVIDRLVIVKGIGKWTAEIFLMVSLQRPDVLPADDLGIQKAVRQAYNLADWPKPQKVLEIGEHWRPYRTLASRYLWKSLEIRDFGK